MKLLLGLILFVLLIPYIGSILGGLLTAVGGLIIAVFQYWYFIPLFFIFMGIMCFVIVKTATVEDKKDDNEI